MFHVPKLSVGFGFPNSCWKCTERAVHATGQNVPYISMHYGSFAINLICLFVLIDFTSFRVNVYTVCHITGCHHMHLLGQKLNGSLGWENIVSWPLTSFKRKTKTHRVLAKATDRLHSKGYRFGMNHHEPIIKHSNPFLLSLCELVFTVFDTYKLKQQNQLPNWEIGLITSVFLK